MLEIITILAVAALAVYLVRNKAASRPPQQSIPAPKEPVAPKEQLTLELNLDGTQPFTGERGFLKGFGLSPAHALDVRTVPGPVSAKALPAIVRRCLQDCFKEGTTRGPDVVQLLAEKRELQEGESLYLVLMRQNKAHPTVAALVDKTL